MLTNLRELDLSDNCLMQHSKLIPLLYLAALQRLNLQGNPICYHVDHRNLTAYNLHKNTGTVKFLLDRKVMTRSEIKRLGSVRPIQTRKPLLPTSASSSSVGANIPERSRRTREAAIKDDYEKPNLEESLASVSSLITSTEHIETRRQIEELREKFGSTWLYKEGGSLVQDVLGKLIFYSFYLNKYKSNGCFPYIYFLLSTLYKHITFLFYGRYT